MQYAADYGSHRRIGTLGAETNRTTANHANRVVGDTVQFFSIATIKQAIEHLQNYRGNWLLPAFVFAANNVGVDSFVDMSKKLGTDRFLDRYFHGGLIGVAPFQTGNNLLRPRLKDVKPWRTGPYAGDYVVRQDTKMWGNLFSSRGYRDMRQRGEIDGEHAIVRLTDLFQPTFEQQIPSDFRFEYFLVWLFAFNGFANDISTWASLYESLTKSLELDDFLPPYRGRFTVDSSDLSWPETTLVQPTHVEFQEALCPKLASELHLVDSDTTPEVDAKENHAKDVLPEDDEILSTVNDAINRKESLAFLLLGPPGTGKTLYARRLAASITSSDQDRVLFLQFHPAIGYDDFIEGFRPRSQDAGTGIRYELDPRLFLKFSKRAEDADDDKKYVVVIDEINRGDIARVFGELLTYMEPDYRGRRFTLPLSEDRVIIPSNLIIIATANPFDRSITDLDDAMLRRFWVIELSPDEALLRSHLATLQVESDVIERTAKLFKVVNASMPYGFGHTSFLRVRTIEDLAAVWMGRVRMTVRRAYLHDEEAFKKVEADVNALLFNDHEASVDDT